MEVTVIVASGWTYTVAEMITLATEAGYDVEIKATPTADGGPGRMKVPMAMINMLAAAKSRLNE